MSYVYIFSVTETKTAYITANYPYYHIYSQYTFSFTEVIQYCNAMMKSNFKPMSKFKWYLLNYRI